MPPPLADKFNQRDIVKRHIVNLEDLVRFRI